MNENSEERLRAKHPMSDANTRRTFNFIIAIHSTPICRAFLKEHCDVGTFVDQHIAAGVYSRQLAQIYENYFGDDK